MPGLKRQAHLKPLNVNDKHTPLLIRIYFYTQSRFAQAITAARACFVGLWLGILGKEKIHAVDKEYYSRSKRGLPGEYNYHSQEYNRRGLWDWEERMLTDYFKDCKRLLIVGAGGGREVLALRRLGFHVDAFESHPALVVAANELLQAESYEPTVHHIPRDQGPNTGTTYDGIVVGWGLYTLVQGRKRRVALLQQLRSQTQTQGPILISFFYRFGTPRAYKISTFVANTIRQVLRRELVDVGDWLVPNYAHFFTQEEIVSELSESGFDVVHYSTTEYGHAIGIAV